MPATLACARAGVTTGEWAGALREVFGEYRAPTGCRRRGRPPRPTASLRAVRDAVRAHDGELGTRLRLLVGKPGLDGHSNGAEQIAVRARDAGFEVVYQGIRLTPAQIVVGGGRGGRALRRAVDPVRVAPRAGARGAAAARRGGLGDVPVVVGGIIPEADARWLREHGVAAVFTPKDFGITEIIGQIVEEIRRANGLEPLGPA